MRLIDADALIAEMHNVILEDGEDRSTFYEVIERQQTIEPEPKWIPVKFRPMDEDERKYYSELYGYDIEYQSEYAVIFDCPMPDDKQEVWVCSKCGNVWLDECVIDDGIGLEGNGDWMDIVAWMPFEKPEPYKEGEKK